MLDFFLSYTSLIQFLKYFLNHKKTGREDTPLPLPKEQLQTSPRSYQWVEMSALTCRQPRLSGCHHHTAVTQQLHGHCRDNAQQPASSHTIFPFLSPGQDGQSRARPVSSQMQHPWCHGSVPPAPSWCDQRKHHQDPEDHRVYKPGHVAALGGGEAS